jgi:hypothetical protein
MEKGRKYDGLINFFLLSIGCWDTMKVIKKKDGGYAKNA